MDVLAGAGRFAAEQQHVLVLEGVIEIRGAGAGGEEDEANALAFSPCLEGAPIGMAHHGNLMEVIHSGAAEGAVGGWEAGGLDDMRLDPKARTEPQNRPRILRDVRFKKSDAHAAPTREVRAGRRLKHRCGRRWCGFWFAVKEHALAGLRSSGKGANRNPAGFRRLPPFPEAGSGGSPAANETPFSVVRCAGGLAGKTGKGLVTVTTMSSAEPTRRDFLYIATGMVGAVGAAATLVPLVGQMNPDASTIAAGAPIQVDLAPIAEGQIIKVFWRSKPIFIFHRTAKDVDLARQVNVSSLPDPQPDQDRVKQGHDQWLVVIGICTHLGCIPVAHEGNYDGWFCPCHGSQYDSSGRIRQGPAPANLPLPPYSFVSDSQIQIG